MLIVNKPDILFYQKLGLLFYAVAACDNTIEKIEFDTLKNIVKNYWVYFEPAENEHKKTMAYQIEIFFEWFDYEKRDALDCFDSFCNFALKYPEKFSDEKTTLITKTATAIADSFASKNKNELIMLAKLEIFFHKLNKKTA